MRQRQRTLSFAISAIVFAGTAVRVADEPRRNQATAFGCKVTHDLTHPEICFVMDEEYLNLFTSDHFVADVKSELTFPGLSRLSLGLGHEWVSIYIGGE